MPTPLFDGSTPGPGRPKGSGNKATEALKKFIRERTQDGTVLVGILMDMMYEEEPATKLGAIKILLEYGFGKPKESVELSGDLKLSSLYDEMRNRQLRKVD